MLRLQTQIFQDRFTHIYPTNWLINNMKMCLFHLLLPMTPLFCNPLSTQSSLRKVGQVPPTSQSQKRSMGGGVPRLRSRKADKSPGCRNKAFCSQFLPTSSVWPRICSRWLTRERILPIKWSCGRRVEAIRSVDNCIWLMCCSVPLGIFGWGVM